MPWLISDLVFLSSSTMGWWWWEWWWKWDSSPSFKNKKVLRVLEEKRKSANIYHSRKEKYKKETKNYIQVSFCVKQHIPKNEDKRRRRPNIDPCFGSQLQIIALQRNLGGCSKKFKTDRNNLTIIILWWRKGHYRILSHKIRERHWNRQPTQTFLNFNLSNQTTKKKEGRRHQGKTHQWCWWKKC